VVGATAAPLSNLPLNGAFQMIPSSVTMATGVPVSALVSAEGDLMLSGAPGTQGWVELRLYVDGSMVRALRSSAVNYIFGNMPSAWHISTIVALAAGPHEFHVEARTLSAAGGPMVVNSVPGNLSVALLVRQ
jgi:hypothetical protein